MHFNQFLFFFGTVAAASAATLETKLVTSDNIAVSSETLLSTIPSTLDKPTTTGIDSTNNKDAVQDKIVINPKNTHLNSQGGIVAASASVPVFHPRFGVPVQTFRPRFGTPVRTIRPRIGTPAETFRPRIGIPVNRENSFTKVEKSQ